MRKARLVGNKIDNRRAGLSESSTNDNFMERQTIYAMFQATLIVADGIAVIVQSDAFQPLRRTDNKALFRGLEVTVSIRSGCGQGRRRQEIQQQNKQHKPTDLAAGAGHDQGHKCYCS